jgi:glycosyltransferase involved in cell wall biosynthesis
MTAVDVLLPVRHPSPWLTATLAGLAVQDSDDWRLVVVIHGVDQGISSTVRESGLAADVVVVDDGCSLAEVLNAGLARCTAPLVARLDADDVPLPSRLRVQRECLAQNPDCVLVASPAVVIGEDGSVLGKRAIPETGRELMISLAWRNRIIHPAVMFRRVPVLAAGGYSALAQHTEDYDLWLRILSSHDACVSSLPAIQYRVHEGQVTSTKVIGKSARARILEARMAFARARDIPTPIARAQHVIWSIRQIMRGWQSHSRIS